MFSYNVCVTTQQEVKNMVAKTGKPPARSPREVQTRIRMTKKEADMLEECAKHFNTTKTEIVIRGIQQVYTSINE
jgi:hypothetical protein